MNRTFEFIYDDSDDDDVWSIEIYDAYPDHHGMMTCIGRVDLFSGHLHVDAPVKSGRSHIIEVPTVVQPEWLTEKLNQILV